MESHEIQAVTNNLLMEVLVELKRIAREQTTTRELIGKFVYAMIDGAEKEVPEFMRRFANYMHDLHDIKYMYEEHGQHPPPHIFREIERCDDRFRWLLTELHKGGGAFEKIRREMASDPLNKWDHTRFLPPSKENGA